MLEQLNPDKNPRLKKLVDVAIDGAIDGYEDLKKLRTYTGENWTDGRRMEARNSTVKILNVPRLLASIGNNVEIATHADRRLSEAVTPKLLVGAKP